VTTEAVSAHQHRSSVEHVWHVWINRRQDQRRATGEQWESDLYAWKDALRELERIPLWLKRVRENTLPTLHKQCSQQDPEPIAENRLICALGTNVAECPILKSLYETVAEHSAIKHYSDVTVEDADALGGKVCAWHIFRTVFGITGDRASYIDTSEGYVQDESDRMYWRRVYDNLSAVDASELAS
jgi:hypothetical protein